MTSTPVKEYVASMYNVPKAGNVAETKTGDADTFSTLLGQAGNTKMTEQNVVAQTEKTGKNDAEKLLDRKRETNPKLEAKEEVSGKDVTESEGVETVLSEAEQEICEKIADKFGVSVEDVIAAMETLGLTFMDLTDQANMVLLTGNLMDGVDAVTVMMDEQLFADVSEMTEMVTMTLEEVANQFGMTLEELASYMDVPESEVRTETIEVNGAVGVEETDDFTLVVEDERTAVSEDVEAVMAKKQGELAEQNGNQSNGQEAKEQNASGSLAGQNVVLQQNVASQSVNTEMSFTEMSRTQQIMEQITEYVRVHAQDTVTELEIRLNPANLGTVNLHVVAKEGSIYAQLTAQNEAVRQALESQTFTLKETLQQQGIKVDAVEVTVASHEFERNLEQNEERSERQNQSKTNRRAINLEGLSDEEVEDLANDMTEAQMIRIDMMNRSGNKVDFMA